MKYIFHNVVIENEIIILYRCKYKRAMKLSNIICYAVLKPKPYCKMLSPG